MQTSLGSISHDMTDSGAHTLEDMLFSLPRHIMADERYRALYEEISLRLRTEAMGIPMTTMQTILIERLATKYVIIRYKEENGWGEGINTEKDANAQWSDLMKEWNRLLAAGHEQLRDALLAKMEEIAKGAVDLFDEREPRQNLRRYFNEQFSALGL